MVMYRIRLPEVLAQNPEDAKQLAASILASLEPEQLASYMEAEEIAEDGRT